jgi:hypothetical protein
VKRSAVLMAASNTAALGWLATFADSAYRDHHPREGNQPEPESNCLLTSDDADKLRARALEYIRAASRSGQLAAQRERELAYLLYRWRDFAGDDGGEVRHWTNEQLTSEEMVVKFAEAFTSHSWSQGMGFAGLGDTGWPGAIFGLVCPHFSRLWTRTASVPALRNWPIAKAFRRPTPRWLANSLQHGNVMMQIRMIRI